MNKIRINRIKIVLTENNKTGKWLADCLQVTPITVSKWCTNAAQPNLQTLYDIADLLNVSAKDLLNDNQN